MGAPSCIHFQDRCQVTDWLLNMPQWSAASRWCLGGSAVVPVSWCYFYVFWWLYCQRLSWKKRETLLLGCMLWWLCNYISGLSGAAHFGGHVSKGCLTLTAQRHMLVCWSGRHDHINVSRTAAALWIASSSYTYILIYIYTVYTVYVCAFAGDKV